MSPVGSEPQPVERRVVPNSAGKPRVVRPRGYRAERKIRHAAIGLGLLTAALGLFCLVPSVLAARPVAPAWTQLTIPGSTLLVAFGLWQMTTPDWAVAKVQMFACAILAAVYGAGLMIVLTTAHDKAAILGLQGVRESAPWWAGATVVLLGAAAFWCGSQSQQWRRWGELRRDLKIPRCQALSKSTAGDSAAAAKSA